MTDKEEIIIIDNKSFKLGMVFCFAEMVASGVKKIALSPPLSPEEYKDINNKSEQIANRFGIYSYLEKSILITELFTKENIQNIFGNIIEEDKNHDIWVIMYYKNKKSLEEYLVLKEKQRDLITACCYNKKAKHTIALEFGRLLSYPDDVILEMIS